MTIPPSQAVSAIRVTSSVVCLSASCLLAPGIALLVYLVASAPPDSAARHRPLYVATSRLVCALSHALPCSSVLLAAGEIVQRLRALRRVRPERYLARKCALGAMLSAPEPKKKSSWSPDESRKLFDASALLVVALALATSALAGAASGQLAGVVVVAAVGGARFEAMLAADDEVGWATRITYVACVAIPIVLALVLVPLAARRSADRRRRAAAVDGYRDARSSLEGAKRSPASGARHGSSVLALAHDMDRNSRAVPPGCAQAYFGETAEVRGAVASCCAAVVASLPLAARLAADMLAPVIVPRLGQTSTVVWVDSALPCVAWYAVGAALVPLASVPFSPPFRRSLRRLPCFRRSPPRRRSRVVDESRDCKLIAASKIAADGSRQVLPVASA